jgi:DNA-binding transcriptional regulator YiaG
LAIRKRLRLGTTELPPHLDAGDPMTGAEIRQCRHDLGLTQRLFAQALGVTRITVCMYENCHVTISRAVQLAVEALMRRRQESDGAEEVPMLIKSKRISDIDRVRALVESTTDIDDLAELAGITDMRALMEPFQSIRSRKERDIIIRWELRQRILGRDPAHVISVAASWNKYSRAIANLGAG